MWPSSGIRCRCFRSIVIASALANAHCGTDAPPCEPQDIAVIPSDPSSPWDLQLTRLGVGPTRLLAWQSAYVPVDPAPSQAVGVHLWHVDDTGTVVEWEGMPTPCFPECQQETYLSTISVDADRVALGWAWTPELIDYRVGVSVWQPIGSSFWELPSPGPYARSVPQYEQVAWSEELVLATWFENNSAEPQRPNLVVGTYMMDGTPVGAPVVVAAAVDTDMTRGRDYRVRIVSTGAADPMAHLIVQTDSDAIWQIPVSEGPTLGDVQTLGEPGDVFLEALAGVNDPELALCRNGDLVVIAGSDSWVVPQGCSNARLSKLDGARWVSWTQGEMTQFARLAETTITFECEIPATSTVFAQLDGNPTIEWIEDLTLRAFVLDEL